MARADSIVTCPACGKDFQKRGATWHIDACTRRLGKREPRAPIVDGAAPPPEPTVQPAKPQEPTPAGRPEGRPRYQSWKGGARGQS